MNYLEDLACWYFRLNGYFLISNFVNHKDDDLPYTHDTDFLGVRFPHVYETIGGTPDDYDSEITSDEKICCVIGEVKSGRYNQGEIISNIDILKKNISRLGVFNSNVVTTIANELINQKEYEFENVKILKVLVKTDANQYDNQKYISIDKGKIVSEIQRRKELYRKEPDRLFFNSNLIQYLFSD